jgi:hypothetical protein
LKLQIRLPKRGDGLRNSNCITTRHGSIALNGSSPSVCLAFRETCKVLGIRRPSTTSYQPASNSKIERWHKDIQTALSHYINSANTNWDTILPFVLMAKRATPHSVTAYSPSYLLHGTDTQLPSNDSLKAHCVKENINQHRRLKNLRVPDGV